jgi:hypothetical protein
MVDVATGEANDRELTPEHNDPELSAKLEACERAVAAFIAAVDEWLKAVTMSAVFQQRAKLSLAKAAVLEAMKALPLDAPDGPLSSVLDLS